MRLRIHRNAVHEDLLKSSKRDPLVPKAPKAPRASTKATRMTAMANMLVAVNNMSAEDLQKSLARAQELLKLKGVGHV